MEPRKIETELDKTLLTALTHLKEITPTDPEFATLTDQVNKLHKMREDMKPDRVKKDTAALIAANLIGIAMITHFERTNVITSKALAFITKLR